VVDEHDEMILDEDEHLQKMNEKLKKKSKKKY